MLELSISRIASDPLQATVLVLDGTAQPYPLIRGTPIPASFDGDGRTELAVPLGGSSCGTHAVIVASHSEPGFAIGSLFPSDLAWSARFSTSSIRTDAVALGFNPEGHLITPGTIASSTVGTTEVGVRWAPASTPGAELEGLAHADPGVPQCPCEGWGVADAISATSGWATVSWPGLAGLELLSFVKDDDSATSVVSMAGLLEVTHAIQPVSTTDYLFRWDVTLKNTSDEPVAARYRRVLSWAVEPYPDETFASLVEAIGPIAPYWFSSDDGRASPNPLAGPSVIEHAGFFAHAHSGKPGALIDLRWAAIAPGGSVTVTFYYGAAPNAAAAVDVLESLEANIYSLGQPSDVTGVLDPSGVTFVFAIKDVQIEV